MQNIMLSYFRKKEQGALSIALSEFFTDTPHAFSDYVVLVYISMFVIWIVTIVRKVYNMTRNFYYRDTHLVELHRATYENDTLLALKICKKYPQCINKTIDEEKFTPFLRACYHGNTQLVKYMLEVGADINSKTARGENGLYLAVYNRIKNRRCRDATCIHALFHANVDVNAVNANNLNVLQLAAMFGHTSLTRWLLSKNVNFNVDPSPYMLAKIAGHTETANLLRELHILSE